MELFYCADISEGGTHLNPEESLHCVKVLRHKAGETINVIDGHGFLYRCTIVDANPAKLVFSVEEAVEGYGSHNYRLHMAVAPPKNIDRFEWFAEKATEIGVDEITPVFGDYSERKVFKPERTLRIMVSAAKQSHKAAVPQLHEACTVRDFILKMRDFEGGKFICYCDKAEGKRDIREALGCCRNAVIMIGPEGDFSRSEIELALENGFLPLSLGESRLRIETAALVAVAAMYLDNTTKQYKGK